MEQVEALIDLEGSEGDGRVQGDDVESEFREPEVNGNQIVVETMKYMVAKLDQMSTKLVELENSVTRLDNVPVTETFPTVLPRGQSRCQTPITSQSATPAPLITSTPAKTTSDVKFKPSDIKVLELDALQRLGSAARLQMFFESVEQCTSNSNTRLEVAKSRVDGDLAVMIHTAQRQGEIVEWTDCKAYLTQEFGANLSFDQAWRQGDTFHYVWSESPQSFVHKFKCHYASIRGTYHSETLPDRDRLLKRKLLQGFPKNSRDLLEAFMDDNIPLNKFIGHVENERVMLLNAHASVNSIPSSPVPVKDTPSPLSRSGSQNSVNSQTTTSKSTKSEDSLAEITAKLDQLQKQISRAPASKTLVPPRKFCAFCQTETHFLKDCWRKPERGHCFDCLKFGCRRGSPACPGKAARTPVARPNNVRKPTTSTNAVSLSNTNSSVGATNASVNDTSQ